MPLLEALKDGDQNGKESPGGTPPPMEEVPERGVLPHLENLRIAARSPRATCSSRSQGRCGSWTST